MYLLLILSLLSSPAFAAGKTILIKRSKAKKQALLDYKFVFMEEQSAFKSSSPQESSLRAPKGGLPRQSNPISSKLNNLSKPLAIKPKVIVKAPSTTLASNTTKTSTQPGLLRRDAPGNDAVTKADIYDESDWDNYATTTEIEESFGVQAWIIDRQQ
ncbi:MAG: hypothetical protein OXU45_04515 [Candidatus Melainabacteria bacterium]|nr:hypothetical protein [Candidatus Melainabacteria bacterium]